MQRDDSVYLHHILEAIDAVSGYIAGVDRGSFLVAPMLRDAVIRQLEIIGEATRRLSAETRALHPDTPWRDIAGMRDKLIHRYFGVDLDAVWIAASEDLAVLRDVVEGLLGRD
jgi:uncharacterized protein with HEPN domain